jgi:hypothetical protein
MQKYIYFDEYDVRAEVQKHFSEKYTEENLEDFWGDLMELHAESSQEGILIMSADMLDYDYYWNDAPEFKEFYTDVLGLVQREAGCDRAGINFKF